MDSAILLVGVILLLLIGIAVWQKIYKGIPVLVIVFLIYAGMKIVMNFPTEGSKQEFRISETKKDNHIIMASEDTSTVEIDTQLVIEPVDSLPVIHESTVQSDEPKTDMVLRRIVVCREVSTDRTTLGADKVFPQDIGELSCFTAVENLGTADSVTHVWYYRGKEMASINLEVGRSPFWRTWSIKSIQPDLVGDWQVVVFDSRGYQLGFYSFQIIESQIESSVLKEE